MYKKLGIMLLMSGVVVFQFCSGSKKTSSSSSAPKVKTVNYVADVAPLISTKCGPCHISPNGKKKFLDTYAFAKENIDDIIARIEKAPTDRGFMPFKKTEKLSDSVINVFVQWKNTGLAEK